MGLGVPVTVAELVQGIGIWLLLLELKAHLSTTVNMSVVPRKGV